MPALPPIYKAFEALSRDKRFDGLELEFRREVDSGPPQYEIRVEAPSRGDVADYATLISALGDFANEHDLDSNMFLHTVTLTPRS